MIAIIDCGIGNLRSICNALDKLRNDNRINEDYILTNDKSKIRLSDAIILPGVGEFGSMMDQLEKLELSSLIKNLVKKEKKILGICLGMQILFESSEESPNKKGLSIFKGTITKFSNKNFKIPQMGWNSIYNKSLWQEFVYFANSYCLDYSKNNIFQNLCTDNLEIFTSNYSNEFISGIICNNITAYQFHPEKSGEFGLKLIENWVNQDLNRQLGGLKC